MSFNLQHWIKRQASKSKIDTTTEGQLDHKGKEPNTLTEDQLESERQEIKPVTIQALLEKVRTGEGNKSVEGMMNESKSGLVKHRNSKTSDGCIPKLEEQRIASERAENEKYEAASTTDKDLMLPHVKGKDGLKTAKTVRFQKQAQFDEPFSLGFLERESPSWDESEQFERISPDLGGFGRRGPHKTDRDIEDEALIDKLTRDIDVPDDDELDAIDEKYTMDDDLGKETVPEEEDSDKLEIPEDFVEGSSQDINVGTSSLRQIVLLFDADDFSGKADIKRRAKTYLFSHYPSLFSFKVGREPIEIGKNLTVDMNEGKVIATLPTAAFKPKNKAL